jgi:5'-nucleotidase
MTSILLTNDDGIDSPGLAVLREALTGLGEVVTIAPSRNQSAVARSITIGRPLRVRRACLSSGAPGFAVGGTPVDCVRVGLLGVVGPSPDLVVSGINLGANMGNDVSYSGTVGAVLEACLHGLQGVAVSVESRTPSHLPTFTGVLANLVRQLLNHALPPGVVLNVNLPDLPARKLSGARVTTLGGASCHDRVALQSDDGLGGEYEVSCLRPSAVAVPDDFTAVAQGFVSLTPLHYELTSQPGLDVLAEWTLDEVVGASVGALRGGGA